MSAGVLTVGETMALLDPVGELTYGSTFTLRAAGAESNVAIGLSRLGVPVRWISRLGADPLGDMILATVIQEGVDASLVTRDPDAPTGLFYKARAGARTDVYYYRAASAASKLSAGDVPEAALDGIGLVHLTGITMALSPSARELTVDLARRARGRGLVVLYDPNWRPSLWTAPDEAAAACAELLPYADWVLCSLDEGRVLFGGEQPEQVIEAIRAGGAGDAVVRVGAEGAVAVVDGKVVRVPPERVVDPVDEVGAGDAFAAGFAYGLLQGWSVKDTVRAANRLGSAALEGPGDWETLPPAAGLAGLPAEVAPRPADARRIDRGER